MLSIFIVLSMAVFTSIIMTINGLINQYNKIYTVPHKLQIEK